VRTERQGHSSRGPHTGLDIPLRHSHLFLFRVESMAFLERLLGITSHDRRSPEQAKETAPTGRETVRDPVLFAQWISQYVVLSRTFEQDQECVPPEDLCEKWKVSEADKHRCANELILLRVLGACMFVRTNLDEEFYLRFRDTLIPIVAERMNRYSPSMHRDDVCQADVDRSSV